MKSVIFICLLSIVAFQAFSQGKLQVASGTTITSSDAAQIVLDDTDLDNDGAIEQNSGDGISFTGIHPGLISGKGVNRFSKLVLAKSGRTSLLLRSDVSVNGRIQFTEGRLDLKDNNIYLGNTGLLEGESELSHLFSTGKGYVESIHDQYNALTINPGNLGAMITSASSLGKTIVRRGHLSQVNTMTGNESILRYYDIVPANDRNVNATVRFRYFDKESNDIDEAEFSILRSDGIGWSDLGADAKSTSLNFVEKRGITQFSRFTLSTPSSTGKAAFTIWPNPVIQNANLRFPANETGNMKISIYDSRGKLVQVQEARIGVGINEVEVDMKKLPQGNYTIQTNWAGQSKTSRVNKM
jgi:hypothetical protein